MSKCLSRTYIEEMLERMLQVNGEQGLNKSRDSARIVSESLGMTAEFETLNSIIGAMLSTKPGGILSSAAAVARIKGEPFDDGRVKLLSLVKTLKRPVCILKDAMPSRMVIFS